jgi:hypothetical protein
MAEKLSAGTLWFYGLYNEDPYARKIVKNELNYSKPIPISDKLLAKFLKGEEVWLGWRIFKDVEMVDINKGQIPVPLK